MNTMKPFLASLCLLTATSALSAETIDVYYLGGQSNATNQWRIGIESELKSAYGERPFAIVHCYHPGQWLRKWITDAPQGLFLKDFYNDESTGVLEQEWRKLTAEGKVPVLRGFFWLQGEGDTGNYDEQAVYSERFNTMRSLVADHFGQSPPPFVVAVIDGNQDPKYDDPGQAAGRTREKIEGMRQVLFQLGEQADGAAFDTRDFPRTDLWHLTKEAQREVGEAMARLWLATFND
jgi:hypothetical protein